MATESTGRNSRRDLQNAHPVRITKQTIPFELANAVEDAAFAEVPLVVSWEPDTVAQLGVLLYLATRLDIECYDVDGNRLLPVILNGGAIDEFIKLLGIAVPYRA